MSGTGGGGGGGSASARIVGGGGGGGAAPEKRPANLDWIAGADKRRLFEEQRSAMMRQNTKRGAASMASAAAGFNVMKRSRFVPEPQDVENMKRNANCMGNVQLPPGVCSADKRARTNGDYKIRIDPFVQAHMDAFKKTAAQKINNLQSNLDTAMAENKMLKTAVPALNKRYQEASAKVSQLERVVATYAAEVQRLRAQVRSIVFSRDHTLCLFSYNESGVVIL